MGLGGRKTPLTTRRERVSSKTMAKQCSNPGCSGDAQFWVRYPTEPEHSVCSCILHANTPTWKLFFSNKGVYTAGTSIKFVKMVERVEDEKGKTPVVYLPSPPKEPKETAKDFAKSLRKTKTEEPPHQKEKTMPKTEEYTLTQTIKQDGADAAYRLAGSQLVKTVRDPLSAALARHLAPGDDAVRGKIADFLQTEWGTALLAGVLSMALGALPEIPATGGAHTPRLARELRVRAMADLGDSAADILMAPLRDVISMYLRDMGGVPTPENPSQLPEGSPSAVSIFENQQARVTTPA